MTGAQASYPIDEVQGLYRTIADLRQQVAELQRELSMRKLQQDAADRGARLVNQRRHELAKHKRAKALPTTIRSQT